MPFRIVLADTALEDLRALSAFHRAAVRDAIEQHLTHQPRKTSKSRIKKLEDIESPEYRLRIDEFRVFYDVVENDVVILAVLLKKDSVQWLKEREKSGD